MPVTISDAVFAVSVTVCVLVGSYWLARIHIQTVNQEEPVMAGQYRKKPIVIEAIRYTGSPKSFDEIWNWMGGHDGPNNGYAGTDDDPREFGITTLEGRMNVNPGDWVIKGIKGEFYPCKADIFEATYEAVTE